MTQVELRHGARTDVGRVREVNEDAYLASPPVFVVADGMGGHDGGEVASRIVTEEFEPLGESDPSDEQRARRLVGEALASCQRRIRDYSVEQIVAGRARGYAGTTAVAALLVDHERPGWLVANLGDSRAYRLHEGRLEQVSVDHSLVQELVDAGRISAEEAATHPERHVITRALGPDPAEPDLFWLPLDEVDRLLLCSDGINGMIDDAAIETILVEARDPGDAADRLVSAALAAGGRDNATAVVVEVVGRPDEPAAH